MKKEHKWLLVGYLAGSFFPVQSILGLFGGVNRSVRTSVGTNAGP